MKLVFYTQNVNRESFIDLCRLSWDYGFSGFEIYDALEERRNHYDSILKKENIANARRKLLNRGLQVTALVYPTAIDSSEADPDTLLKYIRLAENSGIKTIIISLDNKPDYEMLDEILTPSIKACEKADVEILFETKNNLASTKNLSEIITHYASVVLGAAWNTRETFFVANETVSAILLMLAS